MAPALAAALAAPVPVVEPVTPSPAVGFSVLAPVTKYASTSPAAAHAAPTPLTEDASPTPAAFNAADLSLVNQKKRLLAAALAEAKAAQRETQKADETLANLNAEALLLDQEQEA